MMVYKLLSVELLVLIAALFLMVYIAKQQVSKWFTYGSGLIVIVSVLMMACTVCCAICMHHQRGREMRKGHGPHKMMIYRMHDGMPGEEGDEMMEGECKEPGCTGEMQIGKHITKEIIINDNDSMPHKEVIIRKR